MGIVPVVLIDGGYGFEESESHLLWLAEKLSERCSRALKHQRYVDNNIQNHSIIAICCGPFVRHLTWCSVQLRTGGDELPSV